MRSVNLWTSHITGPPVRACRTPPSRGHHDGGAPQGFPRRGKSRAKASTLPLSVHATPLGVWVQSSALCPASKGLIGHPVGEWRGAGFVGWPSDKSGPRSRGGQGWRLLPPCVPPGRVPVCVPAGAHAVGVASTTRTPRWGHVPPQSVPNTVGEHPRGAQGADPPGEAEGPPAFFLFCPLFRPVAVGGGVGPVWCRVRVFRRHTPRACV